MFGRLYIVWENFFFRLATKAWGVEGKMPKKIPFSSRDEG